MDYKEKVIALSNSQELPKEQKEKLEDVFPELAESEDEMIRKDIIEAVELHKDFTQVRKEHIYAWLEKQGEHAKFRESIQIGDEVTRNKDGMLVNLSQLKRVAKPNESKQGEQKAKYHDVCDKCVRQPTCQSDCFLQQNEQKPWNEEDDIRLNATVSFLERYKGIDYENTGVCISWLKSLKDRVLPKPADWSEEDEDNFNSAIYYIRRKPYMEKTIEPIVDWLESLKDRVYPQIKYEWSEEDEKMLNRVGGWLDTLCDYLRDSSPDCICDVHESYSWLKSLRPNHWKPNDEQMKALYEETQKSDRIRDERIVSLFEDLNKLK